MTSREPSPSNCSSQLDCVTATFGAVEATARKARAV